MSRRYSNNFQTTTAAAIATGDTTLTLASVSGLPTLGTSDSCYLTLDNGTDIEIVEVTSINSTASTVAVTRGKESTAIAAFASGSTVALRATADSLENVVRLNDETRAIDFGGATSLEIPNGAAPTVNAAGEIAIDTTVANYTGMMKYYDGVEELTVVAMPTANLSTSDSYVVSYNATNSEFEMVAQSGGSVALADLTDATAVTIWTTNDGIRFDNYAYLASNAPRVTGGGITLYAAHYDYRLFGWSNVGGTIYPIVQGDSGDYIGFDANGPIMVSGAKSLSVNDTNVKAAASVVPSADSSFDLGSSSLAWQKVYTDSITFDGGTNNFNYYETGTFSVEIADATTGGNLGSAATTTAQYIRTSDMVVVYVSFININTSGMTAGNTIYIRNFPFTSKNATNLRAYAPSFTNEVALGSNAYIVRMLPNTTYVDLLEPLSTGANIAIVSDMTSNLADIEFTLVYLTS